MKEEAGSGNNELTRGIPRSININFIVAIGEARARVATSHAHVYSDDILIHPLFPSRPFPRTRDGLGVHLDG